ncbi:MAG: hypothetical protein KDK04_09245 [Candidatus Competibacteraceae bacterium]|nr:hypothetical protein [Candidatus Competibacteraceae bacterium]
MRIGSLVVVGAALSALVLAQTPSQARSLVMGQAPAESKPMPSIIISGGAKVQDEKPLSGGEGPQKPLSADDRAYWECVLEHVRDQESSEALNIILAACRALSYDR